jgi:3-hydroxyisobutyrate dehydrogenase-like beta-hydroxyacid dehydrogenase
MGSAMARALARDGHELTLYNRTPDRAVALAAEVGGRAVATPREAAAAANVVISMVADDAAVRALYAGRDGVLAGLGSGTVAIDSSTVLPSVVRELGPAVRDRGAAILDAPVSGSVSLAEAGQLTLMVGGEAADLERARPALESGATMKLAVNAAILGLNEAIAEALVLAEHAGVDRARAYEVFAASAVSAPYVQYKQAAFVHPDTTPVAFSLELAAKDLRLILQLANQVGARLPQAEINRSMLLEAASAGRGGADLSSVASHLRGAPMVDGQRPVGDGP